MTDRDRLIELIKNADNDKNLEWYDLYDLRCGKGCAEYFADYLLANGVTIADSPCDSCRHTPPSSGDGKPCSMCPATPKEVE